MDSSVSMQPHLATGLAPAIICLLIVLSPFAIKLIRKIKSRKERSKQAVQKLINVMPVRGRDKVKQDYIWRLTELRKALKRGGLTPRLCYQRLSVLLREFAKAYGGIETTTKTLTEIKSLQIPELTALIEEYYEPEFAPDTVGDADKAIERTIKVIQEWN